MTNIDKNEINKKIGSFYIIQEEFKAIKKFLKIRANNIVYMKNYKIYKTYLVIF